MKLRIPFAIPGVTVMENAFSVPPGFNQPPESNAFTEEAAVPYHPEPIEYTSPIAQVKQRNEMRLMAIEGVVGVGLQPDELGHQSIVVFLRDRSVQSQIPTALEGFPVTVQVTGEFQAY
jgi:hypothetical protein